MNPSLRTRLLLRHAAFFAVGMVTFACLIWAGARQAMQHDVDVWLDGHLAGLEKFLRSEMRGTGELALLEEAREYSSGLPAGSGVRVRSKEGRTLFAHPAEAMAGSTARMGRRRSVIEGREYELMLWRSSEETDRSLSQLAMLMAGLAPLVLLLSMAGGWWITRRTLEPVDRMTEAARSIGLGSLSDRLPMPSHRDELWRLAAAWNEMLGRLETSAKRLERFTADASHELRTPVAVIRAAAELTLRQPRPAEEYQRALSEIGGQSREMTVTIETLLELARANAGRTSGPKELLSLGRLLEEECGVWRNVAREKQVTLTIAVNDGKDVAILGHAAALKRLAGILLENAIKFTPSGGRVGLTLEAGTDEVRITVQDTGIGISREHLPLVFERFFQADASRSGGGSGLGLALAKSIVASHGGSIQAASEAGRGTAFTVILPTGVRSTCG